jgi:hypothetical protein
MTDVTTKTKETREEVNQVFYLREEAKRLSHLIAEQSETIKDLKSEKFKRFNNEECWMYQDDEDDKLEELVCPVVISATDLIALINKGKEVDKKLENHKHMTVGLWTTDKPDMIPADIKEKYFWEIK